MQWNWYYDKKESNVDLNQLKPEDCVDVLDLEHQKLDKRTSRDDN